MPRSGGRHRAARPQRRWSRPAARAFGRASALAGVLFLAIGGVAALGTHVPSPANAPYLPVTFGTGSSSTTSSTSPSPTTTTSTTSSSTPTTTTSTPSPTTTSPTTSSTVSPAETTTTETSTTTTTTTTSAPPTTTTSPVSIDEVLSPEAPTVVQSGCGSSGSPTDPTVTPASTDGISYDVDGDVEPGATVTVTATPDSSGDTLVSPLPSGWTASSDGSATYTVVLADPDCDGSTVTPEPPDVLQPGCDDGDPTDPEITPAATDGIDYTVRGDVEPGGTVVVVATPESGTSLVSPLPDGWTAGPGGTARYEVELDEPDCDSDGSRTVRPAAPGVRQAACHDGDASDPRITLRRTTGISYDIDGDVEPGETVTVVAEAESGYRLADPLPSGWSAGDDDGDEDTATYRIELRDCDDDSGVGVRGSDDDDSSDGDDSSSDRSDDDGDDGSSSDYGDDGDDGDDGGDSGHHDGDGSRDRTRSDGDNHHDTTAADHHEGSTPAGSGAHGGSTPRASDPVTDAAAELPYTGASVAVPVAAGVILLISGLLTLVAVRRWRTDGRAD